MASTDAPVQTPAGIALTPSPTVAALLAGATPGWNGANGSPQVVSFSFATDGLSSWTDGAGSGFAWFDAAQQAAARQALQAWSAQTGLIFIEVPDQPAGLGVDLRFVFETMTDAAGRGAYPRAGGIWISNAYAGDQMQPGSFGYEMLLHEIGHTLGFKHPFDGSPNLPPELDNTTQTVMSYTHGGGFRSDLGPIDLAAAQYVYGTAADEAARGITAFHDPLAAAIRQEGGTGADIIRGTSGRDVILGGDGNDRIEGMEGWLLADGGAGDDTILLGARAPNGQPYFVGSAEAAVTAGSLVHGGTGNDHIEGGYTADWLFGDDGDDILLGHTGNDLLDGGGGTDSIDGGFGIDTLQVAATRAGTGLTRQVQFYTTDNGDMIFAYQGAATTAHGTATYAAIENFAFADGRLVFAVSDPIAQVQRLYQSALGRAPDADGLNFWADAIDHGSSLRSLAESFLGSQEFLARYGTPDAAGFVQASYLNVFARAPDSGGLSYWTGELDSGRQDRAGVLLGFSESQEHKRRIAEDNPNGFWDRDDGAASVARLYQATLDRRPDEGGLVYWARRLDEGMSLESIAGGFTASTEFTTRYGDPDNAGFIDLLYRNVLDRAADAGGLDYWTGRLETGLTRTGVVLGLSESDEFRGTTAGWIDDGIALG